jgi:hypothetical protein
MALTPKEQDQLNKLIEEGIKLSKQLNDTQQATSFSNFTGSLADAERIVKSLRQDWSEYVSDISGAREGFTRIVDEMKNMNSGLAKSKKSFSDLSSLASKLQSHQQGISILSVKELQNLKKKTAEKVNDLNLSRKLVDEEIASLRSRGQLEADESTRLDKLVIAQSELGNEILENNGFIRQFNTQLDDQIKLEENINSQLGLTGKLMKGITKIPIVGQFIDADEALKKMRDTAKDGGGKIATLGAGLKSVGKEIDKGLSDPLTIPITLVGVMKELDGGAEKFARSMNMTYGEAMKFRNEMETVSGITKGQMQESIAAVGAQLGSNAAITAKDAETFTKLHVRAGLTHEELMGMQSISLANSKSLENNTNEFLAQAKATAATNGVILNEKKLLADVGKISAATTLSLGKNPKELAKAVATAKALGMEMSQLENIAGGLLDFESSIENELSAELLTGKDLNLERARGLALNNDMAGMAEEINKQIGSSADFTKMNRIQQEALGKAVGMSREELAQTLFTQEQLKGLSGEEAEKRQALLDARIEEVGLAQAKKEIETGGVAELEKQAGIQTSFNQSILELKDALANGILPLFSQIADFLASHMGIVKTLIGLYVAMKGVILASNALQAVGILLGKKKAETEKVGLLRSIGDASMKAISSLASIPVVGWALGLAAAGTVAALGYSYMKGDDVMSPGSNKGGYGSRTLFGPEGAIQLNDKDTVIAGTNLFGNDVKSEPGKATQMGSKGEIKVKSEGSDMSAVIAAINALASRPINVSIDGKKVIEATTGAQPNTQGEENRKNSYKVS